MVYIENLKILEVVSYDEAHAVKAKVKYEASDSLEIDKMENRRSVSVSFASWVASQS